MRLLRRDPRLLDAAIAAVLIVGAVVELATAETIGSRPVTVAAALLMTVPVAVRRHFPIGALGFCLATFIAQALAGGSASQTGVPALALLFLIYAIATRRSGLASAVGLVLPTAAIFLGLSIETVRGTDRHTFTDYLIPVLWLTTPWLFGYAMRGRASRIAALENETVRLAREREERARAAVAAERRRIARDLHDVVAHNVSVMVVQAAAAEEVLGRDPERARAPLTAIQETGNQALIEMRRLLGILRAKDEALASGRQPGLAGLDVLVTDFREAGLPVDLTVEGELASLSAGVDLAAYRIVEEALTNALKHARGAETRVSVRRVDGAVELEVDDDGPGPGEGDNGGHGLIGMRERAMLYGGTLHAGRRDGGGFAVRARLPLVSDARGARSDT